MPNLGWPELMIVAVLALVFLGPKRLPEVARQAGRWLRELRSLSGQFREEMRSGFGLDSDNGAGFPYAQPPASKPCALDDAPWTPDVKRSPLADAPWSGPDAS